MGLVVNPSRFAAGGVYDTAFPPMTSDSAPAGYVASASTETGAREAFKAFSQDAGEWWASAAPAWLQIEFPTDRKVDEYSITSISATALSRCPKSWTLSGSADGVSFTVIDTQTAVPGWAYSQTRTYSVAVPAAYKFYRLDVSATQGAGENVRLNELAFSFLSN